jgi:hypothetical protein
MKFNLPANIVEIIKETIRWVVLFLISWIIAETLKQANVVPEVLNLKVWVFVYTIPVRAVFTILLTLLSRLIDRLLHEKNVKSPLDLKSLDVLKK